MQMYNLIEHSNTSGRLWQHYRGDPNDNIAQTESFKYKSKITGKTLAAGNTNDVKIAVSLVFCKINLILILYEDCVISSANGDTKFEITDTKLYVLVVTLSTQDNAKLLTQKCQQKGETNI